MMTFMLAVTTCFVGGNAALKYAKMQVDCHAQIDCLAQIRYKNKDVALEISAYYFFLVGLN